MKCTHDQGITCDHKERRKIRIHEDWIIEFNIPNNICKSEPGRILKLKRTRE